MKKTCLLILFFPFLTLAFDETEIDSLESLGTKRVSKSPWRTQVALTLKRNLDVRSFSPKGKDSWNDLSALLYELTLTLNYSLERIAPRLSRTEFFLTGSFLSDFDGGSCKFLIEAQNPGYIWCNLGNIIGGFQTPFYNKKGFFSDFIFSFIPFPLSHFSKIEGLVSSLTGAFDTLYFLKKEKQWSLALSTSHSFTYSKFTKVLNGPIDIEKGVEKVKGDKYNVPLETTQTVGIVFRQSFNRYLPSNTRLFSSYLIGINLHKPEPNIKGVSVEPNCSPWACGDREHYLFLGGRSSWKLKDRTYLTCSLFWKDKLTAYNPINTKVSAEKEKIDFKLDKWFFGLGLSYSF